MQKNRLTTYLLYAIGEIILVVIGILIAVNINNWNEGRKTGANLRSTIQALRSDLIQDTLRIQQELPNITYQYELNESLRKRIAMPHATVDTLVQIARYEFNPNWTEPIVYHTNAYQTLVATGSIEILPEALKHRIKEFYNQKATQISSAERMTQGYRSKIETYLDTYAFGSTDLHDQGALIDKLIWSDIDHGHLAAAFQGLSNYKRILFRQIQSEMRHSLAASKALIVELDLYLSK